ncbi:PepSY domain-containing protein [Sandaracinobacteroides hominis]|uniref:PepSY domain-containing protein n=1 Tax=Sandaracinobacteroides hominis TaxID=2780086 RepID=UPI001F17D7C6|nr:hypothetical protein [Sandaracinobacteroides hominis]
MINIRYFASRRSFRMMLPAAAMLVLSAPVLAFSPGEGAPRDSRRGYERTAQAYPPGPDRNRPREVSDQEHAKDRSESGQMRPFKELYGRASAIGRGEYLGVEPDISRDIYRFKFMRSDGKVVWVDMDGRTGRVLSARQ